MAEGEEEKTQPDVERDMEALGPQVDEAILEKWTGTTQTKGGSIHVVQGKFTLQFTSCVAGRQNDDFPMRHRSIVCKEKAWCHFHSVRSRGLCGFSQSVA